VREIVMTSRQTDLNVRDIADEAAMDDLRGFAEVRKGTLPRASLPDNIVRLDYTNNRLLLGDGVREGLFAVDVFLMRCGLNRDDGVPVVGNRNHHRVDIGTHEKLAEIVIRCAIFIAVVAVDGVECGLEVIGFDVACGDDLTVGQLEKCFGVVGALHAPADDTNRDAIGSSSARGAKVRTGRDGDGSSSRSEKMAAREGYGAGRTKCPVDHDFLQKKPTSGRGAQSQSAWREPKGNAQTSLALHFGKGKGFAAKRLLFGPRRRTCFRKGGVHVNLSVDTEEWT